jgi:hypothetical protein
VVGLLEFLVFSDSSSSNRRSVGDRIMQITLAMLIPVGSSNTLTFLACILFAYRNQPLNPTEPLEGVA